LAVGVLGVGIWYIATHGGGDSGTGVDASAYNQWQYEQTGFASPVNASNSAVLAPSSVVQAMNADLAGHEASGWTYTVVGQEAWEHQERFNECIEWFDQCHTGDCGTCFGYCMAQGEWDFYNCPP